MFISASETDAFVMLLCAVVSWGSWPFIRSYCRADTPVFAPMFFTGQLLVAFFVCVTLGDALVPSDPDYGQIQWSTAMLHPGHPGRVIAIIIGGHLNGHADSLLSAVCSVLPFGVAFPIYAGWGLAQGTILNYFLLGMPGNPGFLFGGVAFAILAICCLAYSDSYDKPKPKVLSNEIENPILHEILPTEPPTHYDTKDDSIKIEKPTYKMHAFCFNPSDPRKWIYLCFFAGMMTGSWSPLSTLGEVGDGAITNPYVALFLLECGQFSCLPVLLSYYGGGKVSPLEYIRELFLLPAWDVFFGFCSGIAVAMGFVFYYIASSRISPAISFSIAACDPFFTIILGVTFAGQLRGASLGKAALLLNAMLCYAIAIFLIASSIN